MAGKFIRAAHVRREITQIEFRVKRWHKKYESRGTNFWDTLYIESGHGYLIKPLQ